MACSKTGRKAAVFSVSVVGLNCRCRHLPRSPDLGRRPFARNSTFGNSQRKVRLLEPNRKIALQIGHEVHGNVGRSENRANRCPLRIPVYRPRSINGLLWWVTQPDPNTLWAK